MTEKDPKNLNSSNFDKEFSLNREKKTGRSARIPSWIMILAGVAVIGGVVAAKQPVLKTGTGTWSSINAPVGSTVTVSQVFYNGLNDEMAASSELEARITSQTDASAAAKNGKLFITSDEQVVSMEMVPLAVDENGDAVPAEEDSDLPVYWVDEKPYAVMLEPAEDAGESSDPETVSSVYSIDDREYNVRLETVTEDEFAGLPEAEMKNIVRAGGNLYRLDLEPAGQSDPKAAAAGQTKDQTAESPAKEPAMVPDDTASVVSDSSAGKKEADAGDGSAVPEADDVSGEKAGHEEASEGSSAVAWMKGKPYSVTVKPYRETVVPDVKPDEKDIAATAVPVTAVPKPTKTPSAGVSASDQLEETAGDVSEEASGTEADGFEVVPITGFNDGKTDAGTAENKTGGSAGKDSDAAGEPQDEGVTDKTAPGETNVLDPETEAAIRAGAGRFDVSEDQTERAVPLDEAGTDALADKTAVNVPVTVLDDETSEKQEGLTTIVEVEGKRYELRVSEMDPADAPANNGEQPVIWMDDVPLTVTLKQEDGAEDAQADSSAFDIVLNSVAEKDIPALYEERFGVPYVLETEEVVSEPAATEEPETGADSTQAETETPKEENWFVSVFHDIFGNAPTETPVPQVTVIAMTPTQVPAKPTATPIIVQFVPTTAPQGPVRLDESGNLTGTQKDAAQENYSDWDDDPLWEDDNDTLSDDERRATVTAVSRGASQRSTPTPVPQTPTATSEGPAKIEVIMVEPGEDWPTMQPTPEELPHTGGAESWNIPTMLALLAGLMLIIIGVRRLRRSQQ